MNTKLLRYLCWSLCLLTWSACGEIIDDLTLRADGSGVWKLKINLSESTVKINSLLALDSLNGYRVPSIDDIRSRTSRFAYVLRAQPGIQSAQIEFDYTHFIWNLTIDFHSIKELESAVVESLKDQNIKDVGLPPTDFVIFSGNVIQKQFPFDLKRATSKLKQEDKERVATGRYVSILRTPTVILKNSNIRYQIAKNGLATMAKFSLGECMDNSQILSNQTTLK